MGLTKTNEVYKCESCGHIIEVLLSGNHPVCCGKPMNLQEENTQEASKEKHIPVIERTSTGYKVSIGSVLHPMETAHYIQFIELIADGVVHRAFLKPTDQPVVEFSIPVAKSVVAKEYCNLHGYWKASL